MHRIRPNAFEKARVEKKMSKRDLASASGVSEKTLYLWELNGTSKANVQTLAKVAEALGTTVESILC